MTGRRITIKQRALITSICESNGIVVADVIQQFFGCFIQVGKLDKIQASKLIDQLKNAGINRGRFVPRFRTGETRQNGLDAMEMFGRTEGQLH